MAILKDLIVHGSSRFLNKIYAEELETSAFEAESAIIKKLTAKDATLENATVIGLLDVQGQLHTNTWTNSNIATIDGCFYITPTLSSDSGTISFSSTSVASLTGSYSAVTSLYIGDSSSGSTVQWTSGSNVLLTGEVEVNGQWLPLGTLLGTLSANATTSSIGLTGLTDNRHNTSSIITEIRNAVGNTSLNYRNLKISLYQRKDGTDSKPLGIYMTAMGTNGKTFIDIYGGVNATTTAGSSGGFADPNLRIGNLSGLGAVEGTTPTGWGIYTTNGYFKGVIVSSAGKIGGFNIGASSIKNTKTSYSETTNNGVWVGTDGIGLGKGLFYVTNAGALTAKSGSIAGWSFNASSLYKTNATPGYNTSTMVISTGTASTNNIGGGGTSSKTWMISAGTGFGVTTAGALYCNNAHISGEITATSGTIGGASITDGTLTVPAANVSGELTAATINGSKITAGTIAIGKLDTSAQTKINNAVKQSIETIIGTQTSNTYTWTGTSSTLTSSDLINGLTINYFLPYSVGGSQVSATYKRLSDNANINTNGAVLNLTFSDGTSTGNLPIWYQGVGRLTSHYGYGSIIKMTYYENIRMANAYEATGWWVDAQYNSDTFDNRIIYFTGKTGTKGIWAGSLFMEDASGTYQGICCASDGTITTASSGNGARTTATTKIANTNGFKVGSTIYYTNTSYNANTNISGYAVVYSNMGNVFDSRYSMNTTLTAGSLTTYKPWYLVGSINSSDGLFYLDSTWWTQTPNVTGKIYILGGGVYDSTTSYCRITLYEDNAWYVYNGSSLVPYEKYASDQAAKTATTYITDIDSNKGITIKPADTSGNDYLQMNSSAINFYRNNTDVMSLGDSSFRMGTAFGKHTTVDSNGLHVWIGSESTAANEVGLFGSTARIGAPASSRFLLNADSLQAYNSSNVKYFEVSASGLSFGGNAVAKASDIPTTVAELTDSGSYLTTSAASTTYATQTNLNNEINARKAVYGTSSTDAGTATKVVTCSNFALYTGASVTVTFSKTNTSSAPQLNVNSTGAKSIKSYTGANLTEGEYKWAAGATITFTYDGTNWRMQDGGALQAKIDAASSASTASSQAGVATQQATNATNAKTAAESAKTAAQSAKTAAETASSQASSAKDTAVSAKNDAVSAKTDAVSAKGQAQTAANNASQSATNAANSATAAAEVMGGFTILWNYSAFSTSNNGRGYLCAFDSATGTKSDANGWVKWNGTKRTITKQLINPSAISPYNIPVYVVCRLSSTTATTGTNYMVWYNSGWKSATLSNPSTINNSWTWADNTDIILGKFVETASGAALTGYEIYNPPYTSKQITTNVVTAQSAFASATSAARTATSYITNIDSNNGITVKALNGTTGTTLTTDNYIKLNSDGLEIFKGGNSVAQYGDTVRIGKEDSSNVEITDDSMIMSVDNNPLIQMRLNDSIMSVTKRANSKRQDMSNATSCTFVFNTTRYSDFSEAATVQIRLWLEDYSGGQFSHNYSFTYGTSASRTITNHKWGYADESTFSCTLSYNGTDTIVISNWSNNSNYKTIMIHGYYILEKRTASFILGTTDQDVFNTYSVSEGYNCYATGECSHAEGRLTEASNAEAHAEGYSTKASGQYSHAEGYSTEASGQYSHTEGFVTEATEYASHAEGEYTDASGACSHAEGEYTEASGRCSHAGGYYTKASSNYQTAIGKYNIADSSDIYAFIIGNGTFDTRSNALTVDWDGHVVSADGFNSETAVTNFTNIYNNGNEISTLTSSALNNVQITILDSVATYSFLYVQFICQAWSNVYIVPARWTSTTWCKFGYHESSSCRLDYASNKLTFSSPSFASGVTNATVRVYGIKR